MSDVELVVLAVFLVLQVTTWGLVLVLRSALKTSSNTLRALLAEYAAAKDEEGDDE
jgi:hypothetical protein